MKLLQIERIVGTKIPLLMIYSSRNSTGSLIERLATMTDINHSERKTRKVGNVPLAAAKRMKGWEDYMAKAAAFTIAKGEMEHAKDAMREALKVALKGKNLPSGAKVEDHTDLDFTVVGHEVKVVQVLQKKGGRTRNVDDLSVFF